MLIKILKRLAQGGMYSNKVIAKELEMDEALIEQMIIQLQNLGYIQKESIKNPSLSCNCGCGSCSTKGTCCASNNIDINIWKITKKGMLTLENKIKT